MSKPKGSMSSPYVGFAEQMRQSAELFNTVGTEQNLVDTKKEETPKPEPVIVEEVTEQFSTDEISKLISALAKVANIKNASAGSILIDIGGLEVKVTK